MRTVAENGRTLTAIGILSLPWTNFCYVRKDVETRMLSDVATDIIGGIVRAVHTAQSHCTVAIGSNGFIPFLLWPEEFDPHA